MPDFTSLEPISTGDIIDRAVRLYRRNFAPLVTIASVPSIAYYIATLTFVSGYTRLILGITPGVSSSMGGSGSAGEALLMVGLGMIGELIAVLLFLATIAGLSRCIGDDVMLGEAITFKKCWRVVTRRIGDILLMGVLFIVFGVVMYMIVVLVVMILFFIVAFAIGVPSAIGMPGWASSTIGVILVLAGIAGAVIVALMVVSRVVFLPQAVMIEGQPAGQAIGRAFKLGAKNWYRLGAIALFAYFVKLSVSAAIGIPIAAWLGLNGSLTIEIMAQPWWSAIFSAIEQISSLLILPISMISLTLLYFDNRVRKEGYDLDLLTMDLPVSAPAAYTWAPAQSPAPAFARYTTLGLGQRPAGPLLARGPAGWTAPAPPPAVPAFSGTRPATNPGPGIAGAIPPVGTEPSPGQSPQTLGLSWSPPDSGRQAESGSTIQQEMREATNRTCPTCNAPLWPSFKFCQSCGAPVTEPAGEAPIGQQAIHPVSNPASVPEDNPGPSPEASPGDTTA
ncbi:MAG TPA: DUF4013 domain-containing protein [Blastocatellia bacterium]